MAKIIVIDDELGMEALVSRLHFAGHDVERFVSSTEALKNISDVLSSDLIFLDIILPSTFSSSQNSSTECLTAGMEVFREIRKINKSLPIIAYSATQDASVIETLESDSNVHYVSKFGSPSLKKLIGIVNYALGLQNEKLSLNSFIVHGHDDEAKLQLKNYLQNTLHLPEPIILHEQPNKGKTLIEKFECYAECSSIVFVLLTPDDTVAEDSDTDDSKRRARQNVIFEMGYFLGMLGRGSGRVLLLYKGFLDIPSDIAGITYIDISNGIQSASEEIRREIDHVVQ